MLQSPVLTIARTEAESDRLLSSNVDPADHEFILGTTTSGKGVAEVVMDAERRGASGSQIDHLETEWISKNRLVTFDQGELPISRKDNIADIHPVDKRYSRNSKHPQRLTSRPHGKSTKQHRVDRMQKAGFVPSDVHIMYSSTP